MVNICGHIETLLVEHDCVIVKGLGAFVASRVSATIDKKRGVMLPPRKELVFNRSLNHNDGMLVGYIAEQEGLSVDEVSRQIDEYVAKVKKQLQINGRYEFAGLGVMRRMGKELSFVEDKSANLLSDSYGFAPLAIEERRMSVKEVVYSRGMRRFVASAAVLTGLLLVSPEVNDGELDSRSMVQTGYVDLLSSKAVAETAEEPVVTQESVTEEESVAEVQSVEPAKVSKYYIVVGSFVGDRDADKYIADMRRRGVDGLVKVANGGKRVRVTAGVFDNHDEAREKNKQLRRLSGFENAWVLTVTE